MPDLMREGLNLSIYGMGMVFFFLTFLVGATVLMSTLLTRFEPVTQPLDHDRERSISTESTPSPKILAAISAAIVKHRNQ